MRIHFIAIGGSTMHNLAIALHLKGYAVSGSDDVIYEPAAGRLEQHGLLPKTLGWNPSRIVPELDAIILGMHAKADNPELVKAQALGLKIYSYPEYIYEQSKDKTRVVIGGSHGKTTITSMILHVLNHYRRDFDYLVGAQLDGFDTMVKITTQAPVIVIEGDEYLSSPIDRRPKFHLYRANLAVISGIAWDHINVFPTFGDYISQFDKFIYTIFPNGKLFYAENDDELKKVVHQAKVKIERIPYGPAAAETRDGVTYLEGNIPLKIFGDHNLMNLSAARMVCLELGVSAADFNSAMTTFKGASKRLELILNTSLTKLFKDFAHSPSKLKATIEAVKTQFPNDKLVACMELHTFSSLNTEFLAQYHHCMDRADVKVVYVDQAAARQKGMNLLKEEVIREAFASPDLFFFDDRNSLESFLKGLNVTHLNLLMMSSGTFGGLDLKKLACELNV